MSIRLVTAIAACDASDSASRWSEGENGTMAPLEGSSALMSCSTPMVSLS